MFNVDVYTNYLTRIMAIDSVSGFHEEIQAYIIEVLTEHSIPYSVINKGGVVAHLGAESSHKTAIMAHMDTIGMMVRRINSDGTVEICPIGGLSPVYEVGRNVRIHTMNKGVVFGTVQKKNHSVHNMNSQEKRTVEPGEFYVILDYEVNSKSQVEELGVRVGDMIASDSCLVIRNNYIKSRFLDDKASVALLLTLLHEFTTQEIHPKKNLDLYFSAFEEIGHGATIIDNETSEIIALEIACMSPSQNSSDHEVSIYPNFGGYISSRELVKTLVMCAEKHNIKYNLDIIINGGNDCISAINAGHDVMFCSLGFGTIASHGYERSHFDSIRETYNLIYSYVMEK